MVTRKHGHIIWGAVFVLYQCRTCVLLVSYQFFRIAHVVLLHSYQCPCLCFLDGKFVPCFLDGKFVQSFYAIKALSLGANKFPLCKR